MPGVCQSPAVERYQPAICIPAFDDDIHEHLASVFIVLAVLGTSMGLLPDLLTICLGMLVKVSSGGWAQLSEALLPAVATPPRLSVELVFSCQRTQDPRTV